MQKVVGSSPIIRSLASPASVRAASEGQIVLPGSRRSRRSRMVVSASERVIAVPASSSAEMAAYAPAATAPKS